MNQKLAEFKQIMKNNETFRKMDDIAFEYDYIIKSAYLRRGKAEINIVRANEDYMPNVYYNEESFYNPVAHWEIDTISYGPLEFDEYKKFAEKVNNAYEMVKAFQEIDLSKLPSIDEYEND